MKATPPKPGEKDLGDFIGGRRLRPPSAQGFRCGGHLGAAGVEKKATPALCAPSLWLFGCSDDGQGLWVISCVLCCWCGFFSLLMANFLEIQDFLHYRHLLFLLLSDASFMLLCRASLEKCFQLLKQMTRKERPFLVLAAHAHFNKLRPIQLCRGT